MTDEHDTTTPECDHQDSTEITVLSDKEREFVCNTCGLGWSKR